MMAAAHEWLGKYHSFVVFDVLARPLLKAYPAAAGLHAALKGTGNGGRCQLSEKKTG